jgi:hypothetical protein
VQLPPDIPSEAAPFLQEMGWLDPDRLGVGDPAPDVPLLTPEGEARRTSGLWAERPAVVLFGSYT